MRVAASHTTNKSLLHTIKSKLAKHHTLNLKINQCMMFSQKEFYSMMEVN